MFWLRDILQHDGTASPAQEEKDWRGNMGWGWGGVGRRRRACVPFGERGEVEVLGMSNPISLLFTLTCAVCPNLTSAILCCLTCASVILLLCVPTSPPPSSKHAVPSWCVRLFCTSFSPSLPPLCLAPGPPIRCSRYSRRRSACTKLSGSPRAQPVRRRPRAT